ncbi:MAG: hypothetical protein V7638_4233 [Acidobacteriota bacterium]|jgi:hypothetical protein
MLKTVTKRKWTILGLITLVWAALTIVWSYAFVIVPPGSTRGYETTRFVFLSISAFGVLFSSLLASLNAVEASLNLQDRLLFDRVENSFRYIERWESLVLKEARDYTRGLQAEQDSISPTELCRRIEGPVQIEEREEQRKLQRSVISMFNYFEEIELAIEAGRVEGNLLERTFKDTYLGIYDSFRPWIANYLETEQQVILAALQKRWL